MRGRWAIAVAALFGGAALARRLAEKARKKGPAERADDQVDETIRESFPASDPPSWTLGEERRR